MTTKTLYESDYAAWADENARLLRTRHLHDADIDHIVEELQSLSDQQHSSLERCTVTIIEHLLKLKLNQAGILARNHNKWKKTVLVRQQKIRSLLRRSSSLKHDFTTELMVLAYQEAIQRFQVEEFCGALSVPRECPFTWEEILGDQVMVMREGSRGTK